MRNKKHLVLLCDVKPPLPPTPTPALSLGVIVPAKNEEARIQSCLRSLASCTGLSQLRIIAVNDRSNDTTAQLMHEERNRTTKDLISVVNISNLPAGWLGKTNACWQGYQTLIKENQKNIPDYLLFTDADVVFHKRALFEAALYMKLKNLDFLTALPRPEFIGRLEAAFLLSFGVSLNFFTRPWSLLTPKGRNHLGIGAFLMVRTEVYRKLGGHDFIRMCVAEDLKLGLLFRAAEARCAVVDAADRLSVRWQNGFIASLRGLQKNAYASFDYSDLMLTIGCLTLFILFLSPWLSLLTGILMSDHLLLALSGINLTILLLLDFVAARRMKIPVVTGILLSPLMVIAQIIALWGSAYAVRFRDGITWRDSFYPLKDLKRGNYNFRTAFKR